MPWLLTAVALAGLSGVPGLFMNRYGSGGERIACALIVAAALCGLGAVVQVFYDGDPLLLAWSWNIPGAAFIVRLDALAAFFLMPLCLVAAAGAIYGLMYMAQSHHPENGRQFRLFYGLVVAAVMLVVCAGNSLLFLFAWELMAVSGFFLITADDQLEEARKAGFVYLAASHTGVLALLAMFVLLEQGSGSFTFPAAGLLVAQGGSAAAIFLLGLFGFGLKAGLIPLHIWLPAAHAAAPSHASALLSGVMIKTGIYGLMRLTSFFSEIPFWWGGSLLALGALSAVFGVVLALAQHDIKRLLAYHSVENIGIIALGLGMALVGRSLAEPLLVMLGLGGALLHVVNHGLFKSLLFLSVGSVVQATGTRDLSQYGGLSKHQPLTALLFLGGAVAISGLPPFNGFISEWLIYTGVFSSAGKDVGGGIAILLIAPVLALTGALALACFVKVFGMTFLGHPRSDAVVQAKEAPALMLAPMMVLLGFCAWIGLLPQTLGPLLLNAVGSWNSAALEMPTALPLQSLTNISVFAWVLLLTCGVSIWWLQRRRHHVVRSLGTWGCGYQLPNQRMQYSAGSFADTIVALFHFGLWTRRHGGQARGLFPVGEHLTCHTPDIVLDRAIIPASSGISWLFVRLRSWVQNGLLAFYLLYIALTLIFFLLWFM
ncbi:proton-conducting transporter membrane subunit [Pelovirga terrestris]|uniref:Hydrogenase n=1 Tax=Pelovirga terrestris TaxID=2771352 RepID=A0A8J6QT64_9BACT|nr:proton-conducting transporter membrane subunit [Pelovirga terrestris]MBD1401560.1 hydrogenase [Pelovirga terrestris]